VSLPNRYRMLVIADMTSAEFFIINIVGNFGTVFLDNGYYNKAISASPVDALPGYVMGYTNHPRRCRVL